jgi:hypothetical protein
LSSIIVSGAIGNKPNNGGNAWAVLSWLLGLKRLGFDVYLVEQIATETCVGTDGASAWFAGSANAAYFRHVVNRYGFTDKSALVCDGGAAVIGLSWPDLLDVAGEAELLVNISGHLRLPALLQRVRRKVYLDLDPGYTQFWHEAGIDKAHLESHDAFFTVGENVGASGCEIPTCGIAWRPVRQPAVLSEWPVVPASDQHRFTTVASWRGAYGRVEHGDRSYGQKAHEFRKIVETPQRAANYRFEIALDAHPADFADVAALESHGWQLASPECVAGTPDAFRDYVQGSGGELSAAQGIYVETNSGWFSDRSVRYLASGRPVVVQDTGFSKHMPVGEGLFAYRTQGDITSALEAIGANYDAHAQAAGQLAGEYFNSDAVLARFLNQAGVA